MTNIEKLKILKENYPLNNIKFAEVLDHYIKELELEINKDKYYEEMHTQFTQVIRDKEINILSTKILNTSLVYVSDFIAIKDNHNYKVIKSLIFKIGTIIDEKQYRELILNAKSPIIIPKSLVDLYLNKEHDTHE